MKTISSISGGKTSAMMAVLYPADHYVFSVVLTSQEEAITKDKGLLKACQQKIPHFKASRELDQTLINVLKLEQLIGTEIEWVAAPFTFDQLITGTTDYPGYRNGKIMLPNAKKRFCTQQLKLLPIFWHCYTKYITKDNPLIYMNIGFRWDEPKRVSGWTCDHDKIKFATHCSLSGTMQWKYKHLEWRVTQFPLYQDKITKQDVQKFWDDKKWVFPAISNCNFCFHHREFQQQVQASKYPERAQWWIDMETKAQSSFNSKKKLTSILSQGVLDVFEDIEQPMCHCTD